MVVPLYRHEVRNMKIMNINKDSSFMNEVEINLNRLGALLLNQVG